MEVTQGCSMISNVSMARQSTDLDLENIYEPEIELEDIEELQFVEDFHPLTDQVLEYSYRPMVKNFYSGPSHWKYIQNKKKTRSRERRIESKPIEINDLINLDAAMENFIIKDQISSEKFSISKNEEKSWLLKKLKLPKDFHFSFLIFDGFSYANFGLDEKIKDFNELRDKQFDRMEELFEEDVDMHEQNTTADFSRNDVTFTKPLRDNLKQPKKIDVKAIKEILLAVIKTESECGKSNVKFSDINKKVSKMYEQGETS